MHAEATHSAPGMRMRPPCFPLAGKRHSEYASGMGFTTLAATAAATAAALPRVMEYQAYKQESKNLSRAADAQERLANEQAENKIDIAMRNMRAENRNADERLSQAYADAGVSNLAEDGSVAVRETDLATRLQDEINLRTTSALQDANTTRQQGIYDAWNTRLAAQRAKSMARGSLISGVGSLVGGLAAGLSGTSGSGSNAKRA